MQSQSSALLPLKWKLCTYTKRPPSLTKAPETYPRDLRILELKGSRLAVFIDEKWEAPRPLVVGPRGRGGSNPGVWHLALLGVLLESCAALSVSSNCWASVSKIS